jgi:hypothetical protein
MVSDKSVLNAEKTNLLKLSPIKFSQYPINLIYADQTLVETNTIKFLGLQLDSQLTWKTHIHYLLNKLSTVCCVMRRLSQILNIKTLRIVYFAHFHSLIKYGIIFWGNSTTMHKVFLIQENIIRIMLEIGSRCSCRIRFKVLEILLVPSLYIFSLMMFVVNNVDEFQTNSSVHGINTRCKIQLHIPSIRLSSIEKGVTYSSVKISNSLPSDILKLQIDKLIFKSALRRYLLTHVFYSVEEFSSLEQTIIYLHLKFF